MILARLLNWLKSSPTEKPKDLIVFDKSIERLWDASNKLHKSVDELDALLNQMRSHKTRSKRKVA